MTLLASSPAESPIDLPGDIRSANWRDFVRRGLLTQLLCLAIALLIWLLSPDSAGNLLTSWIYSAAIGTLCWLFIDGSRLLLFAWLPQHRRSPGERLARSPGPLWMRLCVVGGALLGYGLGTRLGDAVTGLTSPSLLQNRPALAISLLAAAGATWYFYTIEKLRQRQAEAESARRAAVESQLRLLQSQLEPHMLFNTLANLRVLMALDPPRAQAMLDRLIGWLRATLGASRRDRQPLSAEFAMVDDYLALMALRMGARLQVRLDLPEALRDLAVPPLLLQPLVENSIRHGLEPQVAGGRVEVRARQQGEMLQLTVRDTGVGLAATGGASVTADDAAGFGTRHVAERLRALYGARARFTLRAANDTEGGTLAELLLPLPEGRPARAAER